MASACGLKPCGSRSTSEPPMFPVTQPVVCSFRVVAILVAGWAGVTAMYAMNFRFDSSSELEMVKQVDVEVGGAIALAVVLFFVPNRIRKPKQCILILGVALLIWVFFSWSLIAHHNWEDRVRSGALSVEGGAANSHLSFRRSRDGVTTTASLAAATLRSASVAGSPAAAHCSSFACDVNVSRLRTG